MGNFSAHGFLLAAEMLVALLIVMTCREYVRAAAAAKLGDPTPRLWGRLRIDPRAWFDPFGSGLIPGLTAILWAVSVLVVPAAYGKPAPIDPAYLRRQPRDTVLVSLAGPLTSLAITILAGLAARLQVSGDVTVAMVVLAYTAASLTIFHLLPIPGLDGGRLVALLLSPQIRDGFRNFDRYLPLIVLLILFLGLTIRFLEILASAVCNAAVGVSCRGVMQLS